VTNEEALDPQWFVWWVGGEGVLYPLLVRRNDVGLNVTTWGAEVRPWQKYPELGGWVYKTFDAARAAYIGYLDNRCLEARKVHQDATAELEFSQRAYRQAEQWKEEDLKRLYGIDLDKKG
jgi:hypothetical protein